jgi:hypothetical protein
MKNPLDIQLLEELSNLEYFIVKAPLNSRDFWKEWQDKFSRAYMTRIAIKKLLRTKKDILRGSVQVQVYDRTLRRCALLFGASEEPCPSDEGRLFSGAKHRV